MTSLEDRFEASYPVLARLGRTDANGIPKPNAMMQEIAPDLARIIGEACFGSLWTRPGLTIEQRSLATISIITVLRRDENLKGHIESGLAVGLSAEQIVEVMIQLIFYTGAPIANTALRVASDVFKEKGIRVDPNKAFDPKEDPEELYRSGVAKRNEVMGKQGTEGLANSGEVDKDRDRYLLEYLWGSVWPRPGLDLKSRCICTLSALTVVGTDQTIRDYVGAGIRVGLTESELRELFFHLTFYTGYPIAQRTSHIASQVLGS